MRGLTTRGVRPCLRHYTVSSSLPIVRRTILPPTRRSLTAADAFAILLAPVLTAAFVLDVTAKKDRSQEWDRQIAAVEEEAEQLRQRQLEAWSRIQHRSVSRGAWQQRRTMYTAAVQARNTLLDEEMDPRDIEKEITQADGATTIDGGVDAENDTVSPDTAENARNQARYERLIATRLALQFMVQMRTARTDWRTPGDPVFQASSSYSQSMDYLVSELAKVNYLLQGVKIHTIPFGTNVPLAERSKKAELGQRLADLVDSYKRSVIHLPDFIMSYVQLIAEYKLGPPVISYVDMMRVFSNYTENFAMAAMCETALWEGHQFLNSYHLANMFFRHGSDADSARMYELLSRLQKKDSFPKALVRWEQVSVNDVRITVPGSTNPFLMTNLIRAALCNQQQTFAEAYATLLLERNPVFFDGRSKWHMVSCFLQSYAAWGSWNTGRRWLQTAVTWAHEYLQFGTDVLGRVILRMLDFCVACDRQEEYEMIVEAAIAASIPPPSIDPSRPHQFSERMGQVRLDWLERTRGLYGDEPHWKALKLDHIRHFQKLLEKKFDKNQNVPTKPFHPSDALKSNPSLAWPSRLAIEPENAKQEGSTILAKDVTSHSAATTSPNKRTQTEDPIQSQTVKTKSLPSSQPENTIQAGSIPQTIDEPYTFTSPFFTQPTESMKMRSVRAYSSLATQSSVMPPFLTDFSEQSDEFAELQEKLRSTEERLLQAEERFERLALHHESVQNAFARISARTELISVSAARNVVSQPIDSQVKVLVETEKEHSNITPVTYHDIVHDHLREKRELMMDGDNVSHPTRGTSGFAKVSNHHRKDRSRCQT